MRNLIILGNNHFEKPVGAPYDRATKYAKALVAQGDTRVFLASIHMPLDLDLDKAREIGPSIYIVGRPSKDSNRKKSFLERTFLTTFNFRPANFYMRNFKTFLEALDGVTTILIWPSLFAVNLVIYRKVFKKWGYRVIVEANEIQMGIALNRPIPTEPVKLALFCLSFPLIFLEAFLNDFINYRFDGVIAISTRIERVSKLMRNPSIRVPILSDDIADEPPITVPEDGPLELGFTGTIGIKKEGMLNLFKALSRLKKYPYRLNLYGEGDRKSMAILTAFLKQHDMQNRVIFHGTVPMDEVAGILKRQHLLLLPRPSNIQTDYGFSTKLAGYLASGVPVLMTDISDNACYLADDDSALIVQPDNIGQLYEKLEWCFEHRDRLPQIGERGRKVAQKNFTCSNYQKALSDFLFDSRSK